MKRALLVQLPVPSFRWPFLDANIPLAAGYLASWARAHAAGWEVDVLPWEESDVLGDEALYRAILSRTPQVVGFSLYLWNLDRSLDLARRLSAAGVSVVLGGPEVSADNGWIPAARDRWAAISGEGEEAFSRLLRGPFDPVGPEPQCPPVDLSQLPSPYLSGVLGPYPDRSVWIETLRGCPYRCAYCNYGKQFSGPRPFPDGWLAGNLDWCHSRGVREVYLMDPSFNARADWEETLAVLQRANSDGSLGYHTELVADVLRPGDGRRLARLGLSSCEVGLQSIHRDVLSTVGRRWDRRRWVRGVRELVDEGVSVVVGLIVGLPGDTLGRFSRSLEFVLQEAPGAEIQLFPLALLPGTELRERADSMGLEAMDRPPYTVTRTRTFSREDLSAAFDRFEEATGLEVDPLPAPRLTGPWEGGGAGRWLSGIRINAKVPADRRSEWVEALAPRAATHLTVWFQGWDDAFPAQVARLTRQLAHGVLTLVFDDGAGWPVSRLASCLAAGTGYHYLDRYLGQHLYGQGAKLVPRLVVLASPEDRRATPEWLADMRSLADLVWAVDARPGWAGQALKLAAEGETVYVRGDVSTDELSACAEGLGADAQGLVFSSETVQREWERLRGEEGFRIDETRVSVP